MARAAACDLPDRPQGWGRGSPWSGPWVTIIHTKLKSTGRREGWGSVPPAPTSTWLTLGWEETRTSLVPAVHAGCPGT